MLTPGLLQHCPSRCFRAAECWMLRLKRSLPRSMPTISDIRSLTHFGIFLGGGHALRLWTCVSSRSLNPSQQIPTGATFALLSIRQRALGSAAFKLIKTQRWKERESVRGRRTGVSLSSFWRRLLELSGGARPGR